MSDKIDGSPNMATWEALCVTDPAHTKGFKRAGGFSGTAVKPQWVVRRLTEHFGAVGVGWGMGEPSFQIVPTGQEVLVFCKVSAWHTDETNVFWGVGGDKVAVQRQSGMFTDDEAFKKAYTDAVMNAFKFLGVAADVHMGLFDDNKYVAEAKEAFAQPKNPTVSVQPEGLDWYGASGTGMSAYAAKQKKLDVVHDQWRQEIASIPTTEALQVWARNHDEEIKALPWSWRVEIREEWDARKAEL